MQIDSHNENKRVPGVTTTLKILITKDRNILYTLFSYNITPKPQLTVSGRVQDVPITLHSDYIFRHNSFVPPCIRTPV